MGQNDWGLFPRGLLIRSWGYVCVCVCVCVLCVRVCVCVCVLGGGCGIAGCRAAQSKQVINIHWGMYIDYLFCEGLLI
jgi:hypothetical protein